MMEGILRSIIREKKNMEILELHNAK